MTLELQPFTADRAEILIRWAVSEAFLLQWVGTTFRYPLTREQIEEHLEAARGEAPTILPFAVVDTEAGAMVGYLELCDLNQVHRSATIGRVIVGEPAYQGRGVATWMVREVTRRGFEELGLHRIALVVFDFNHAAIRCYERVGFRKEGHLRDARRSGDEYWSLYTMALLEDEWRAPSS
ncbi:MAG: GNAT family N-acetyltransferase [Armatimonadota bacterium]